MGLAALMMTAGSVAGAPPKAEPPPAMPDETWSALMVHRGTAWRVHEPTRRLIEWALKAGLFAESQAAWTELAGSMGLDDQAAFDALLGERALIVLGQPKGDVPSAWAVATCVTPQNAIAMERGLDAAPRGFDQGRPVMLVERGKFRLGRLDHRDGIEEIEGWHRMLLTPVATGEREGWGGGAGGQAGWITRTIGAAEALPRDAGEIVWYQRTDEKGSYLVASVAREEHGWRAKMRATPGVLGLTQAGCERLAKAAAGAQDGAGAGDRAVVLLEISGCLPTQATDLVDPSKELTSEMALLLAAARVGVPSPQWSGERVLVRVERERPEGGLTVVVACEVKDRRAASAWFDALIAGVLEMAGRVQGSGVQAAADLRRDVKLAGNEPSALRLVVLGGVDKTVDKPPVKDAGSEPGTLAWTTFGADAGVVEGGWWVMRYNTGRADRESAAQSLRDVGAEVAGTRWGNRVLTFRARPADLWKASGLEGLEHGAMGPTPLLIAEMESVEVVVRATVQGLEGEASARLTEPKPVRAPEPK